MSCQYRVPAWAAGITATILPFMAMAQEGSLDQRINETVAPISNVIAGTIFYSVPIAGNDFPLIVGWLVIAAAIFTLYFGFVQFRKFGHAIALVKGDYSHPDDAGEVSHFQALATASNIAAQAC